MAGGAKYPRGATGDDSDQPQTTPRTMTTTPPRKGSPWDRKGAHPQSYQSAHHPHVPQRIRRPVNAAKALDLHDVPVMAGRDPDAMLWQEQALKTQMTNPSLTPILASTRNQYRTTWVKGVPISHKSQV